RTLVGNFQTPAGYVAIDSLRRWVYILNQDAPFVYNPWKLHAYDALTTTQMWVITFPTDIGRAENLIDLGTNGAAFRTDGGRVMIVRTAQATPTADLSLQASDSPDPVAAGANVTWSLTVRNDGPWNATGIVVSNQLPPRINFVSATGTLAQCTHTNGLV